MGLIALLVEHCTASADVMGLIPVQAWIFIRLSFITAQVGLITVMNLKS